MSFINNFTTPMRTPICPRAKQGSTSPKGTNRAGIIFFITCFIALSAFQTSLKAQAPTFNYVRTMGGPSQDQQDEGKNIATDPAGNVYTIGYFANTIDIDPGAGVTNFTSNGIFDFFIQKLDPSGNLVWAKQIGGTSDDRAFGIAIDGAGDVVVTGWFFSTVDFDPGAGVFNLTTPGGYDGFVLKLDSDGNFMWAKQLTTTAGSDVLGRSIDTDDFANVYITGPFNGAVDFDPGTGTSTLTSNASSQDGYVLKLNAAGDFIWVTKLGGSLQDEPFGLSVDPSNNVYTTGRFRGTADFDPGSGTFNLSAFVGTDDAYIQKLDFDGNFEWAARIGGNNSDQGFSINATATNVYTTGIFRNTVDFNPGSSTFNITASTLSTFIQNLDTDGNFVWAKHFTGTNATWGYSVSVDATSNVFVSGIFLGTTDFDPGVATSNATSNTANYDIFITKLDGAGGFVWAQTFGSPNSDYSFSSTIDASSHVYTTGYFDLTVDFDPGAGNTSVTSVGNSDLFIQKLTDPFSSNNLTITSFSPGSGRFGTEVVISGTNFTSATNVYFGTVPTTFIVDSPTQIRAIVPAGATFQPITVTKGGLTAYSNNPFIITFPDGDVMTGCAFSSSTLTNATQLGPIALAIGDLNRDGKPDIVSANLVNNSLSILRGLGSSLVLGRPYPSFAPKVDIATGSGPRGVAIGDIDGDGKLDVVVTNSGDNSISVYRNTTTTVGLITFAPRNDFTTGVIPYKVAIRDLDGDGKPDIAVVNQADASGLSVFRNISSAGTISLMAKVDFVTGANPEDLEITDIDSDNKPDILTVNPGDNSFSVLQNTSTIGTIDATSFAPTIDFATGSAASNPLGIAIGDMDLDGDDDVLIANNGDNSVAIFRNSSAAGVITFAPHADFVTGEGSNDVAVSDLDGDGKLDVAVSLQDPSVRGILTTKNATVTSGSFVFNSFQNFQTTGDPYQIGIADFDADGKPDMASSDFNTNVIAILRNQVSSIPEPTTLNFTPNTGPVGTIVTLTSDSFSATPENNVIYLGNVQAPVISSTSTSLTITIPAGATTGNISATVGCQTVFNIFQFTVTNGTCLPVTQRNTLVSLYNDANGDSWTNKTNWLSADESTWFGVTIAGCTVTKLILPSNNLVGPLSNNISNLSDLTELDLSDNQLESELPATLEDMSELTRIVLSQNRFYGEVPSLDDLGEVGTNLSVLDLSENQLSGELPVDLRVVTSLKFLYLDNNQLEGEIPDEYKDLTNLEDFSLHHNYFTGDVPASLVTLTKLKHFWANDNGLVVVAPALGSLPQIQTFDVSNNLLGIIPVFTSPTLTQLKVENNFLDYGDLEPNIGVSGFTYNPQATLPPGGVLTFNVGDPLSIPFSTPGTGNLYQWTKGGANVPAATSSTLTIPSLALSDAGYYIIQIKSSVVPGITLESIPYLVITNPCTGLRTAGDLDTSFDPQIDNLSAIENVEIQSTGKIIASLSSPTTINSAPVEGIIRFNTDGTLDNSFASNSYYAAQKNMIVQPDDKILTTGYILSGAQLVRLNADGSDDVAFNSNTVSYYTGTIFSMALQPDNKIVISHDIYLSSPYLERINSDGTTDVSFAPSITHPVYAMTVQADGKILIGGEFGVLRLQNTGAIDPTFNAIVDASVSDIAVQADGKIILSGGFAFVNGVPHTGIVRLNSDGTTDTSFNVIGITDDPELGHSPGKITIQADGKILFAGEFSSVSGANRRNIVRLNSDGSVDCAFDPGTSSDQVVLDMVLQPDSKIIIGGAFSTYEGVARNGLARINNGSSATITITLQPIDAAVCPGTTATFTTNATGAANLTYKWQYTTGTVYADISDNANYSGTDTKTVTINTTASFGVGRYRCRINGDLATQKITVDKALTMLTIPKPVVVTSNCTATSATLSGPGGFATYSWSNGASTQQIVISNAGNYTLVVTSSGGCISPTSNVITFDSNFCNAPPVITSASAEGIIQSTVTINLLTLLSDPDNNLDLTTLKIKFPPTSGAPATISTSSQLKVDYTGISFAGRDEVIIEVCDLGGKCTQQKITIEITGDIIVYNGISPNGDNMNDFWLIKFIDAIPDTKNNKVSLFNRWGDSVFEIENYNNQDRVFKGIGKSGEVPSGVYFYKIEFTSGRPMMTGYLSVRY